VRNGSPHSWAPPFEPTMSRFPSQNKRAPRHGCPDRAHVHKGADKILEPPNPLSDPSAHPPPPPPHVPPHTHPPRCISLLPRRVTLFKLIKVNGLGSELPGKGTDSQHPRLQKSCELPDWGPNCLELLWNTIIITIRLAIIRTRDHAFVTIVAASLFVCPPRGGKNVSAAGRGARPEQVVKLLTMRIFSVRIQLSFSRGTVEAAPSAHAEDL